LKVLNLSNSKYLTKSPDFSQVPQLEILTLEGCTSLVQVHESIGHLKRLDLLNLKNCTKLKYLPRSIFNLESLKTLDLSGCSAIEKLSEQLQSSLGLFMINLKTASFFGCSSLIELPNFSHTPHLESLELEGCTSLNEVHESIGHLKRLVFLNLRSCKKLRNLPNSISNLESLETLKLRGCCNLENLPEQLGNMTALKELELSFTAIKQLPEFSQTSRLENLILESCTRLVEIPESIEHLKGLELLCLQRCKKLRALSYLDSDGTANEQGHGCGGLISPKSFNRISLLSKVSELYSLTDLDLSDCNLSEDEIPIEFECLSLLRVLNLSINNFRHLPSCISRLPKLECLILNECTALQSISLPRSVISLKANGCTSLERFSVLTNESSGSSDLQLSESLLCIQGSISLGSCNNLSSDSSESIFQVLSLSLSLFMTSTLF
jgi:Leucine-rich repeat (LRR) protein